MNTSHGQGSVRARNACSYRDLNLKPFFLLFLRDFLQWQVVTGMEAEQITESLANYIWFSRVPNAVCISHLLLIDRRTPMDLGRHKWSVFGYIYLEK